MKYVLSATQYEFRISPEAVALVQAKYQQPVYFFRELRDAGNALCLIPGGWQEASKYQRWYAFDIPNPQGENHETSIHRLWDTGPLVKRDHPILVSVVEELGDRAAVGRGKLKVVEVPADAGEIEIVRTNLGEEIQEKRRKWR